MLSENLKKNISFIALILMAAVVAGSSFYYFVIFLPQLPIKKAIIAEQAKIAKERALKEIELKKKEIERDLRDKEIELEIKKIDLENARISQWEKKISSEEQKEAAIKEKNEEERNLASCMKVAAQNYHNSWNFYCSQLKLKENCKLSPEYSERINDEFIKAKEQCEKFFPNSSL